MEDTSPPLILIVDDDDTIRSILVETLKGEGYRVDAASNGEAGLERVRAAPPDLILLDIIMPILDGYKFLEQLQQEQKQKQKQKDEHGAVTIPIVLLSATHALPEAAHAQGVKAVLTKPFDMGVLLALADRLTRAARSDQP